MKIGFDASLAFTPLRAGVPNYIHHLLDALLRTDMANAYTVFHKKSQKIFKKATGSNIQWQPLRCPTHHTLMWSQARLPLALAWRSFDVTHVPGHRVPWVTGGRLIATIYDLVFLKFPETLRSLHRHRLVWYTRQAVHRASHLITISETTKRAVCEAYEINPARVDVVYPGVDHATFRPDVARTKRSTPYVLAVGTLQPRKNHVMLIRAFKQLCARRRDPIELLIAGQRGWMWEPIEEEARKPPFADRVHLLGYVADEQLPSLYAGAELVAIPSFYEGFGLPLLEAMACGAPLIAANIPAFSEATADAALMLDPHDTEAWMEGMLELLGSNERHQQLREKGLARARQFSWERTARETLAIYRKVAAG